MLFVAKAESKLVKHPISYGAGIFSRKMNLTVSHDRYKWSKYAATSIIYETGNSGAGM